ncbi:hypothetical protein SpiGrapes_0764 [Sphaerochaeta pleomorpha str. Grapes]|uniref:Bacterial Ig-like domain-containing protein n=1 Tax=Sphaerochaeta pleomorpha (strain ATCC BAA-1885 / DSM 22778 / Grapes) TaxID=158190 RepID=G8QYN6_SPHPG|nr:hypothetical protein [Sphaerochaeta pleomorpha]AEV28599.1 hypothetical protein SpiGrapes_0764 [Sphaerochaeta pleomorpha str. Grapes]
MRKTIYTLIIPLLALALLTGCEDHVFQTGNLVLRLSCDKFTQVQRNLVPSAEAMAIDTYHITGTGPKGGTVDINATDTTITLGNLAIGKWTLHAEALNSEGAILAKGTTSTILSKATATAVLNLDELSGNGSLSVGFIWPIDQVADDVSIDISLVDQGGNEVSISPAVIDKEHGTAVLTAETLPAGSYMLHAKLYSQGVLVSGAAEAVRIIENTETAGSMMLIIGDLSTTFSITIINDTMMPLKGTIACTPQEPVAGQEVCMTFTPESLPEGVSQDTITALWYCEGDFVSSEGFSYTCIPAAGSHRYDIIVEGESLGSIGSASILVSMPIK